MKSYLQAMAVCIISLFLYPAQGFCNFLEDLEPSKDPTSPTFLPVKVGTGARYDRHNAFSYSVDHQAIGITKEEFGGQKIQNERLPPT